ncbi:MAG: type II toxin-antitoxin system death-on-curing family toxin [Alphaproteobacteria bacterium]|nr:MAG: type II toxin-antitoxin system death-on-curing family toxin [Alphaproteobacteria bacterium]
MTEPEWLPSNLILAIHERQLREFGGPAGVRDAGALESALGRARNRWAYEGANYPQLAAAYAFGIARNHPFVDGNKRAALLAIVTFLGLNDIEFTASEAEAVIMIRRLAAGEIDEDELAGWIAANVSGA